MVVTVEPCIEGRVNMARDKALLDAAESGGAYARVYSWDGPWVSLGRFQSPERALLDHQNTNWVSRPTGGKAVLHGHDVTVGMAANLTDLGIDENAAKRVSTVYRAIVGPLVEAIALAGLPAVLAERTEHVRNAGHTADCFAHVSPNDIVDPSSGEKLCGCALRVTENAVLLQASIPVTTPLVDPKSVFASAHIPATQRVLSLESLAEALRTIRLGVRVHQLV